MSIPERNSAHEECRNEVVQLFAFKGFGRVGMRELATCFGISAGSVYYHYPSKQHLLFDLIEEFQDAALNAISCIEQKKLNVREKIQELIRAHLDLHQEFPLRHGLMEREFFCLNIDHQEIVNVKRIQYEHKLISYLKLSEKPGDPQAEIIATIISKLLNNAKDWVERDNPNEQKRSEILNRFLTDSISHLLVSNPRTHTRPADS